MMGQVSLHYQHRRGDSARCACSTACLAAPWCAPLLQWWLCMPLSASAATHASSVQGCVCSAWQPTAAVQAAGAARVIRGSAVWAAVPRRSSHFDEGLVQLERCG